MRITAHVKLKVLNKQKFLFIVLFIHFFIDLYLILGQYQNDKHIWKFTTCSDTSAVGKLWHVYLLHKPNYQYPPPPPNSHKSNKYFGTYNVQDTVLGPVRDTKINEK